MNGSKAAARTTMALPSSPSSFFSVFSVSSVLSVRGTPCGAPRASSSYPVKPTRTLVLP